MPRSKDGPETPRRNRSHLDWRSWLALAWAACFGVLYGKTVVECRGESIKAWVVGPFVSSEPSRPRNHVGNAPNFEIAAGVSRITR